MLPVWGTAAVLTAPPAPLLSTGYVPGNTSAAQHFNYMLFHITKELNNVLVAAGVSQNDSIDTQLTQSIRLLLNSTIISSSGVISVTATSDTTYILTAASTVTLPASPAAGQRLTFKAKTNATSTISANAGQTIGTVGAASFPLYAQDDYVTLEYDGTSIWYVIGTNGPLISSSQTGGLTCNNSAAWTAILNGFALNSGSNMPIGIYDLEMDLLSTYGAANALLGFSIGVGTTPVSPYSGALYGSSPGSFAAHVAVKGYALTIAGVIQGLYYSNNVANLVVYNANYSIGRISARRIG